jgi:hypothetical protein
MNTELLVALPILVPLWFSPEQHRLQNECLSELAAANGLLKAMDTAFAQSTLNVSIFEDPSSHPLLRNTWNSPTGAREYRLLTISTDGSAYLKSLENEVVNHPKVTTSEVSAAIRKMATQGLEMEANHLLLLCNLRIMFKTLPQSS